MNIDEKDKEKHDGQEQSFDAMHGNHIEAAPKFKRKKKGHFKYPTDEPNERLESFVNEIRKWPSGESLSECDINEYGKWTLYDRLRDYGIFLHSHSEGDTCSDGYSYDVTKYYIMRDFSKVSVNLSDCISIAYHEGQFERYDIPLKEFHKVIDKNNINSSSWNALIDVIFNKCNLLDKYDYYGFRSNSLKNPWWKLVIAFKDGQELTICGENEWPDWVVGIKAVLLRV